jgi:predicted DNA-binding protein (MmcQ/YjbR family)
MLADEIRDYFLAKPAVTEETPFGPEVLVYKVMGKMFATLGIDDNDEFGRTNLKCDPDRAIDLRGEHDAILPGYHMNKQHWNTLVLDGTLSQKLVADLVDHSYELVVAGLPKKHRDNLKASG